MIKKLFTLTILTLMFLTVGVSASENIVIFAMDDFQTWWLTDIQDEIVQVHVDNQIPVTLGVIPAGITELWGEGERFSERVKEWDTYPSIEVAQHGYDHILYFADESYSTQQNQIGLGNDLMKSIGITPRNFIPPFGSANSNTVNILVSLGFHTLYNPVEMSPTSNEDILIIQDQILLCRDGDEGPSCVYKDYSPLKSEIDSKIDEFGVALVLYHMQDFNSNSGFDTNKADSLVALANKLKNDGYTLMTVEQYYQHLNLDEQEIPEEPPVETDKDNDNDGYDEDVDCNDNNQNINPGMQDNTCDGIDNNCNGLIDEDYSETPTTCGIGACQNTGSIQCSLGDLENSCTPKNPTTEICNNFIDDDCDGKIDSEDSDCEVIVLPVCGNGILEEGEWCDEGNQNNAMCLASYGTTCNYCSSKCELIYVQGPTCGDGSVNGNEQCDDGNKISNDGCSSLCKTEKTSTVPKPRFGRWRYWYFRF
jgi:cysteine-rich repeat protein